MTETQTNTTEANNTPSASKSWRETPISQLPHSELKKYLKAIGLPGLPYPMAKANIKDDQLYYSLDTVQSANEPLKIYTDLEHTRVYGIMMRDMPLPSFLPAQGKLLQKALPESQDRLWTVFGDPAFGKSYAFRSFAKVLHPQGAITVDCGGMNMREIFFRTVIDYGKGVKEQFEERAAQGKLSRKTIEDLNAAFPGSVVEKEGRTVIDWDAIGARKSDSEGHTTEDRGTAIIRARDVMQAIYEHEGLGNQSNAFGIKTVPGEFFEAYFSGRPLFLDEFTKCKPDTLDSWQTALQCINGEKGFDSVDIYNPMADSSDDGSPKFITISRSDFKPTFVVGVAGNEAKDGRTTHTLSSSMLSRMHPIYVADPTKEDFEHRISQIITGLPLSTLYTMFEKSQSHKPSQKADQFGEYLLELRTLGLTNNERKTVPEHEMYMLKNWQDTLVAVQRLSAYYFDRMRLMNMDPKILDKYKNEGLEDQLSADGKKLSVTFRTIIDDMSHALRRPIDASPVEQTVPSFSLSAAFSAIDLSMIGNGDPGWFTLGQNWISVLSEAHMNGTQHAPAVRAALQTLAKESKLYPSNLKEAKPTADSKSLADLLKHDPLKALGGSEELKQIRNVVMAAIRTMYPGMRETDDRVVPLMNLGSVWDELKKQDIEEDPHKIVVPNTDINTITQTPVVVAKAYPSYELDLGILEQAGPDHAEEAQAVRNILNSHELLDYRAVLAALAMPDFSELTQDRVWLRSLREFVGEDAGDVEKSGISNEQLDILGGVSKLSPANMAGFDFCALQTANEKNEEVVLYVIRDRINPDEPKMMVVGPSEIPAGLKAELNRNRVTYVNKVDSSAARQVDDFLSEGARARQGIAAIQQGLSQSIMISLMQAFNRVNPIEIGSNDHTAPTNSTFGNLLVNNKGSRHELYVKMMRPKMQ